MFLRQTIQTLLVESLTNLNIRSPSPSLYHVNTEKSVCQLFPERWFDLVLVLRCNNTLLYDRLQSRQYSGRKLEENLQAEIFQTILDEAKESYRWPSLYLYQLNISSSCVGREELVVELVSEKEEDVESNRARVEAWIVQWREQRKTVRPTKRKATAELQN